MIAEEILLEIGPHRDVDIKAVAEGVSDITISGGAPHFWTTPVAGAFDPGKHSVVSFEYFSTAGLESVSLRYRQSDGTITFGGSAPLPKAETWQPFSIDFGGVAPLPPAGDPKMRFHFALDGRPGASLQIRHIKVREPNVEELSAASQVEATRKRRKADADAVLRYLRESFPGSISEIVVRPDSIRVKGNSAESLQLRELLSHEASHGRSVSPVLSADLLGEFEISLPRFSGNGGVVGRDRAVSRWRLDRKDGTPASRCRWADVIEQEGVDVFPKQVSSTRKGLGGVPALSDGNHQIFDLGIGHATVNCVVSSLISGIKKPGFEPFQFEGRDWYYNARQMAQSETTVRTLCERGVVVTMILLVGNRAGEIMTHPQAEPRGVYSMPNLAGEQGASCYRAALRLLSERFSRPETRVSNWVMHNEIDQAGTWTNMGDQPLAGTWRPT